MECATVVEHFLSLCNSRGTIDRRPPPHGTRTHATSMLQETLQTNCKPTQARIYVNTHMRAYLPLDICNKSFDERKTNSRTRWRKKKG